MSRRRKYNKLILIYKNKEVEIYDKKLIETVARYSDLIDIIENPGKSGYLILVKKIKPQQKELISAELIEAKKDCEWHLRKIKGICREYTGYYKDVPGGIKK